jgi:L-iditol 2-dehydrogenase
MMALVKTTKGAGGMELREVPVPRVKQDHVLIKPEAVGICGSDLARYTGKLVDYQPPIILGHEFSGTIVEVGNNVKNLKKGDRVVSETHGIFCGTCHYCVIGQHALCASRKGLGYGIDGAYTERVLVPSEVVHKMPPSLSFEECAVTDTLCAPLHGLVDRIRLEPGDSIAIFGMGAIGLLALQVAKLYGPHRIIAIDVLEGIRLKMARELGADYTVAANTEEVVGRIRECTGGEGVDVCVDAAGSNTALNAALKVTKPSGQILVIGTHAKPEEIDVGQVVTRQLALIGSWSHTWDTWERALRLLAAKKISTKVLITHSFQLDDWKEAFDILLNLQGVKAILKPDAHS